MARPVVIDANIGLGLVLYLPYSKDAILLMRLLRGDQAELVVPILWEYECISGLRSAVFHKLVDIATADQAIQVLLSVEPRRINPTPEIHRSALRWVERLGQSKAYDSQYVALAENLGAEFWSADQRLVSALRELGADWAHWVGEARL